MNKQMTGEDLMEALAALPPDALALPVVLMGCDCWGDGCCVKIEDTRDGSSILIDRTDQCRKDHS